MPGNAIVAATEEMLTTAPPWPAGPPGRMARKACLMPSEVPRMLTSSILRTSSGSRSMTRLEISTPALLTTMSKAAELGDRAGDGPFPARVVGHVQRKERRLGAGLLDRVRGRLAEFFPDVADDDGGSGPGQRLGHARAQPARPARDQRLAAGLAGERGVRTGRPGPPRLARRRAFPPGSARRRVCPQFGLPQPYLPGRLLSRNSLIGSDFSCLTGGDRDEGPAAVVPGLEIGRAHV